MGDELVQNARTLKELQPGQLAIVRRVLSADSIRRRLLDIGLIEGTRVECVGRSPMGDPKAYRIRGAVIAIRAEDAAEVLIDEQEVEKWD